MTSIYTNSSAMIALRALTDISNNLNVTNNRVSTGLRVSSAQDSAAYWAIAAGITADNGALATVKDALAIGKATVDATYDSLDAVRENLVTMRNLMYSARQAGADRASIQTQIDGLLSDMQGKAGSATINGQNYLSVDTSATGYSATRSIVASFSRTAGVIATSTIDLNLANVILIDANGTPTGILDKSRTSAGTTSNILDIDISALTDVAADITTLDESVAIVDAALTDVTNAQQIVGTTQARAATQLTFVSSLIDANKLVVGALVDANMEEESTKLRALQTQQQLAIQSLSIANNATQNVLELFR